MVGSSLAPCFRKSINALSVFLSSATGMHSWKIIFTLNLTSFTRHGYICTSRYAGWGKWNPIALFIYLFLIIMYSICPELLSPISALQACGELIQTMKPCAIRLDSWQSTRCPLLYINTFLNSSNALQMFRIPHFSKRGWSGTWREMNALSRALSCTRNKIVQL